MATSRRRSSPRPLTAGVRRWVLSTLAPFVSRVLRTLPFGARLVRLLAEQTWSRRDAEMLDRYLVSGYQNPRINVQSVLLRHFLISKLFDPTFEQLADEELRHAIELNEIIRRRALELEVTMGSYLDPTRQAAVRQVDQVIADRELEFERRWRAELSERASDPLRVLEFACGSANDYRAFVGFGLAPHLDYTGVDLARKNIENALRRFPDTRFKVASILDLPYADGSFDFVIAADIFEHLAPEEMETALDEACRLAARGVALTFFNMSGAPDHAIQRRGTYHWNRLSAPMIEAHLRRRFSTVRMIPVASWLKETFGYAHSYNRHAYTIFAENDQASPGRMTG